MIDEQTPAPSSADNGSGGPIAAPQVSAPIPAPSLIADGERIVSDAEAEIKSLLQRLHDKIVALGGATWLSDATSELREARNSVEAAAEWLAEHFAKVA